MFPFLFLIQVLENPRTVNGQELGTIEEFRTSGSARICFSNVAIDLKEAEQGYLQYSGIHYASMIVVSDGRPIELTLRDGATLDGFSRKTWDDSNYSLWHSEKNGKITYTFVGTYDEVVSGVGFGSLRVSSDHFLAETDDDPVAEDWHYEFVERIKIFNEKPLNCSVRYNFGWGVILGEEPIVEKSPPSEDK